MTLSSDLPQTILAFDTAMAGIAVGLVTKEGYVISRQIKTQRDQAALLIPMIEEIIAEAGISYKDIDAIGCTIGPGSFTGLRIGITAAKLLQVQLQVPLIGLSSLEVMMRHYASDKPLLIVLESKRQEFYAQYFDTSCIDLTEPFLAVADDVLHRAPFGSYAVGGDAVSRFRSSISQDITCLEEWVQPDPILMVQMVKERLVAGSVNSVIEPLYLREADVSLPKNKIRPLAKE